jgi:hypothetical protein
MIDFISNWSTVKKKKKECSADDNENQRFSD